MPDVSPLASQIIGKAPELLVKLDKYREQNKEAELQCDTLESEILRVKESINTQRNLRQSMEMTNPQTMHATNVCPESDSAAGVEDQT